MIRRGSGAERGDQADNRPLTDHSDIAHVFNRAAWCVRMGVMSDGALVLGGGGVTGRAWELGVLAGLLDAGIDLTSADLVVGTSAGAAVGALVTAAGSDPHALYQRELAPAPPGELVGQFGRGLF